MEIKSIINFKIKTFAMLTYIRWQVGGIKLYT